MFFFNRYEFGSRNIVIMEMVFSKEVIENLIWLD